MRRERKLEAYKRLGPVWFAPREHSTTHAGD